MSNTKDFLGFSRSVAAFLTTCNFCFHTSNVGLIRVVLSSLFPSHTLSLLRQLYICSPKPSALRWLEKSASTAMIFLWVPDLYSNYIYIYSCECACIYIYTSTLTYIPKTSQQIQLDMFQTEALVQERMILEPSPPLCFSFLQFLLWTIHPPFHHPSNSSFHVHHLDLYLQLILGGDALTAHDPIVRKSSPILSSGIMLFSQFIAL